MKKENKKKNFDIYKLVIPSLFLIIILLIILLIKVYNQKDNNANVYNDKTNYNISDRIDTSSIKIDQEKALEIALKDLKMKQNEIFDLDIELENKYGSVVYEVSFNSGIHEYEYYIDATTGKILHSFKEIDY